MSGRRQSSFYWALRLMPAERRRAMFAIYGYCRALDDIADGTDAPEEKRRELARWRAAVADLFAGRPVAIAPVAALAGARDAYGLEAPPLFDLIDGMDMDLEGMRAPDRERLRLYCDRVAGAVGLLAIRVFGRDDAPTRRFAIALGRGLQQVNILRDIAEDAARDRLYLTREDLESAGLDADAPVAALLDEPRFADAVASFAATARRSLGDAAAALPPAPRRLWPACAMMAVYGRLLGRLETAGWPRGPVRVPDRERFWLALRHLGPPALWPDCA